MLTKKRDFSPFIYSLPVILDLLKKKKVSKTVYVAYI